MASTCYQLFHDGKTTKATGKLAFARVVAAESSIVARGCVTRPVFGSGVALDLEAGPDSAWITYVIARVGGRPAAYTTPTLINPWVHASSGPMAHDGAPAVVGVSMDDVRWRINFPFPRLRTRVHLLRRCSTASRAAFQANEIGARGDPQGQMLEATGLQ